MIQEALMEFGEGRRSTHAFNFINDLLVVIGETFENEIYLISMINQFAKDGQLS